MDKREEIKTKQRHKILLNFIILIPLQCGINQNARLDYKNKKLKMNKKSSKNPKQALSRSKDRAVSNKSSVIATKSKIKSIQKAFPIDARQRSDLDMYSTPLKNNSSNKNVNNREKSKTTKCVFTSKNNKTIDSQTRTKSRRQQYEISRIKDITEKKKQAKNNNNQVSASQDFSHMESQRLQNLKRYLIDDTERISKLRKASDAHVIDELSLSQQNIRQCLQKVENQNQALKEHHKSELQKLSQYYESIIQQKTRQVDHLKLQLRDERSVKVKGDVKLKESEVITRCIKQKLQEKEIICGNLGKTLQKQREEHRATMEKLIQCKKEKQQIKSRVEQILQVVRQQIKEKTAQTAIA